MNNNLWIMGSGKLGEGACRWTMLIPGLGFNTEISVCPWPAKFINNGAIALPLSDTRG